MKRRTPHRHARALQTGFSLIELMIALVIAMLVTMGISSIFLNFKSSYDAQDKLGQLQENQRLLLTVLTNTIQTAGYFPDPVNDTRQTVLPADAAPSNADGTLFDQGESVIGTMAADQGHDTLNIRFQTESGDGVMNCLGQSNSTGAKKVWVNTFALNEHQQLTCAVDNGAPVVLVENVDKFVISYGLDTDDDGSVDQLKTATDVTSAKAWSKVRSIQMAVTFLQPVKLKSSDPKTLAPWTQTIALMNTL